MRILLIEDEIKTLQVIQKGLQENGFSVDTAQDGKNGLSKALASEVDLIITDNILPYMNGLELCSIVRKAGLTTPILMLTALGSTENIVKGLDGGADDYLTKPFAFAELTARIRALLKRSSGNKNNNIISAGDLVIQLDTKKVFRGHIEINLTPKEFSLLEYFVNNRNTVLTKMDLAKNVWGIDFDTGTNMVEVYVNYLRKKIDKEFSQKLIHTQFGHGYIFKTS